MKVNVLKRLSTEAKIVDEYSRNGFFSCDIEFPTVGSGMKYECRAGDYDYKEKVPVNQVCFLMYSNGEVCYVRKADPEYVKKYDKDLDEETKKKLSELFDKDRKEFKNIADQVNKIYEEAGKKVEALLKKAGYSKSDGGRI